MKRGVRSSGVVVVVAAFNTESAAVVGMTIGGLVGRRGSFFVGEHYHDVFWKHRSESLKNRMITMLL
jgi:hypothetical protein